MKSQAFADLNMPTDSLNGGRSHCDITHWFVKCYFKTVRGAKSADLNASLPQLMAQVICFTLPAAAAHLQTTLQPYTPSAAPIHAASDSVRNVLAAGTGRSQSRPTKPNINYCSQYSFDYSGPD